MHVLSVCDLLQLKMVAINANMLTVLKMYVA